VEQDAADGKVEDSSISVLDSATCIGEVELDKQCGGRDWAGSRCCKGDGVCAAVRRSYSC